MSLTFALQSLLARHEAYVIEAEEERRRMAASINRLQCDKEELDAVNTRIINENRSLLDQLEDLNRTVATSDTHIQSLNATLQSTRQELIRLSALATRTSQLEAQLSSMETEQAILQENLASTQNDQRSATERWKDAERTISLLREQMDRIEAESKEESERHAEVMNRYERRQHVERQLESAAGPLKGAAAATSLGKCSDGNNLVVSHFVKDILADNASLQMGIMELREMLLGSNEEVQKLRQLMMLHQEIRPDEPRDGPGVTLEKDLERSTPNEPDSIPALHVHHHYHEASNVDAPGRSRSVKTRRPRKRRIASGTTTPRSGYETPRTPYTPSPRSLHPQPWSSAATILAQSSVSIPPSRESRPHRLSMYSTNTRSSIAPSSDLNSPHPSMFDFLSDSSRPTSPDSVQPFSPPLVAHVGKVKSSGRQRGHSIPNSTPSSPMKPQQHSRIVDINPSNHDRNPHGNHAEYNTILEGPEDDSDLSKLLAEAASPNDDVYKPSAGLRRCASHESMLSVTGVPPKQLRKQQSQLFRGTGLKSRTSFGPSSPTTSMVSSKPVISATPVMAASSSEQSANAGRAVSSGAMSTLTLSLNQSSASEKNTLSKRVGGWVWGKWGVAPMASAGNLRAKAAPNAREERPPGVNQKGSLRALKAAKRLSSHVEAVTVDEGLLRESLGEG
ncbi:MAG: hypothetical protein L6R40_000546 [Gallowayella cf. fulva]|nr:MAG: hypothetical protein L6R40_000546 [Xanthomendoza cf. fulva]